VNFHRTFFISTRLFPKKKNIIFKQKNIKKDILKTKTFIYDIKNFHKKKKYQI